MAFCRTQQSLVLVGVYEGHSSYVIYVSLIMKGGMKSLRSSKNGREGEQTGKDWDELGEEMGTKDNDEKQAQIANTSSAAKDKMSKTQGVSSRMEGTNQRLTSGIQSAATNQEVPTEPKAV